MRNILKLSFLAMLVFTGCKNNNTEKDKTPGEVEKITIVHTLGTAEVSKKPKIVVALDYASLETLDELGIKIAGMPKANVPSHLKKYEDNTSIIDLGSLKEINYDKLNDLNPDVIFISARLQEAYPEISKIAPTVYTEIDYKNYIASLEKNFTIFGEIFDKKEETDKAINSLKQRFSSINERTNNSGKKALVVLYNNGKFSAYGKGSRFGLIHDVMGIKEAVENLEIARHGQAVSNEFIQNVNPDYLFIVDRGAVVENKHSSKSEIENKLIQQTDAYKNGKIIYLNPEVWYLSGGGITSINKMISEVEKSL